MNIIKCPHCGGKHQDSGINKDWTCDYCEEVVKVTNTKHMNIIENILKEFEEKFCVKSKDSDDLWLVSIKKPLVGDIYIVFELKQFLKQSIIKALKQARDEVRLEKKATEISVVDDRDWTETDYDLGYNQAIQDQDKKWDKLLW